MNIKYAILKSPDGTERRVPFGKTIANSIPGEVLDRIEIEDVVARIGPGDLIEKVTRAVGIQPCGGCKQRKALLNKWWFELTGKLAEAFK